jgi:16S rRNA A1518/A1519 N6-dimethyltransferase RsmA/KsgA/DIM1 with predicted DNA glycosylase/AP lyase activity
MARQSSLEQWKDIKGYEGLYQVSNEGQVKTLSRKALRRYNSYRTLTERILKPQNDVYLHVTLYKEGRGKVKAIHKLVAEAFIPNPNKYPQVNHKDENKHNNSVDNLEWCSRLYNANYGTSRKRISNKLNKSVQQFDLDGNFVAEYNSLKQLKELTGFDQGLVSCVCRGIYKQCYGYKFKYKEG